jgi:signal transduction histidine kinase
MPAKGFRPRHQVLVVFLGIMGVLGGALAWLCWRLVEQDRQLESQRVQDRLEQAADRIAGTLTARVQEFDRWLTSAEALPAGVALLLDTGRNITVQPPERVLYLPPAAAREPDDSVFSEGERNEFQRRDSAAAAAVFRALAVSPKAEIRAGALVRLARNLHKLGQNAEALETYGQLALLKDVSVESVPADLMALEARCRILEGQGRREPLRETARKIDEGLRKCRWALSSAAWDFHREEARRWADATGLSTTERQALALSRAAEWIRGAGLHTLQPKGRRILSFTEGEVLVSWNVDAARLTAVLAGPDAVGEAWQQAQKEKGIRAAVVDADGAVLLGALQSSGRRAVRSPAVAGMAATLLVMPDDPAAESASATAHRGFLLLGFAVLALILVAGSGFILHAMLRERQVTQMQSEFVSAVSHEFRTPLTSLRQLSEMLIEDRIPSEGDRRQSYRMMFHATERLQRLVESLLDFGRMEAEAFPYRFEPADPRALVDRVVEEFRGQAANGHEIVLDHALTLPPVSVDAEAMGVALWNLLDNAAKYSPDSPTVWVETAEQDGHVAIVVRDHGMGIDPGEQSRVFERFVRGAAAQRSSIKGTGIGLSMARHIVRAHGGEIRLSSQPKKGTTVTILLPI